MTQINTRINITLTTMDIEHLKQEGTLKFSSPHFELKINKEK